jgi:hypothetical protein
VDLTYSPSSLPLINGLTSAEFIVLDSILFYFVDYVRIRYIRVAAASGPFRVEIKTLSSGPLSSTRGHPTMIAKSRSVSEGFNPSEEDLR